MTYQSIDTHQDQIFLALGDPTRRAILEKLRRTPMAVGALASEMPVSRPAVSQHLKVLKEASLVTAHKKGVSTEYLLNREGLSSVRRWLDWMWDDALEAFALYLEEEGIKKDD